MKLFKDIDRNKVLYGGLITTFAILYGATAFVSWYHAITFFNIANAVWLSVILSFVAEIGQASALFSLLLTENKKIFLTWFVMVVLTALQIIGNVVSSYDWIIKHNSEGVESFQKSILFWMQTADPEIFKVVIAWISGALLPVIALSMTALVAQNIDLRAHKAKTKLDDELKPEPKQPEAIDARDIISEVSKIRLNEEQLEQIEQLLSSKKPIEKPPVEEVPSVVTDKGLEVTSNPKVEVTNEHKFISPRVPVREIEINHKPSIEEILADLSPEARQYMKKALEEDTPPIEQLSNEEVIPHYSDEEVNEMFMDEYERKGEYFKDEEDELDKEVARLSPEVVITQTNGLVDIVPEPVKESIPEDTTKSDEEEKKRIEEERLERLRAIARENLKKK